MRQQDKRIKDFIITNTEIARGKNAPVLLCYNKSDDKLKYFAAKVYSKQKLPSDNSLNNNVNREIDLLQKLNHENIMKIETVIPSKNNIYLILEMYDAENLNLFCKRYNRMFGRRLSTRLIQHITGQIINGLNHIHMCGYNYKDLKLDNIMITFTPENINNLKKAFKGRIDEKKVYMRNMRNILWQRHKDLANSTNSLFSEFSSSQKYIAEKDDKEDEFKDYFYYQEFFTKDSSDMS